MNITAVQLILSAFALTIISPSVLFAQNEDVAALAQQEKEMLDLFYETSSLATRTPQPVGETPALITVITAEDIQHMGARDVRDVLTHTPNVQIGIVAVGTPQITMRGMQSSGAEKVKIMVDGHDVANPLTGGGASFFLDMPVDYIQKIEVLREPGSTLYGSDALIGVINIVTTRSLHLDRTVASSRFDTFDSQRLNVEHSRSVGNLHIWGNANYFNTNGPNVFIAEDALSSTANAAISNAPSSTNEWQERSDFSLAANTDAVRFQCQYISQRDGGYFNPGMTLSDNTNIDMDYFWSDLAYETSFWQDLLSLQTKLIYNHYDHDYRINLQPAEFRNENGMYPDGIYSFQQATIDEYGAELQLDGHFFTDHLLTVGSEIKKSRLHDVNHLANYDPAPLSAIIDVSDTFNWMESADRFFYSFFLQDQWQIDKNTLIVLGSRFDDYDDVGNALSSSLGLSYRFHPQYRLKLQYGEGFRAPSYRELYKLPAGSPLRGDTNLEPESNQTYQATIEWQKDVNLKVEFAGFASKAEDVINKEYESSQSISNTFTNGGTYDSKGVELSVSCRISPVDLSANISYTDSENDTGDDVPGVAPWLGSAVINWPFADYYNFNISFSYTGKAAAAVDDSRGEVDDFLLTDMALSLKDGLGHIQGLEIIASVHNLFDVNYAYPEYSGKLVNHYQRPGISADLWLRYRF
ncbi:MAG: TonB-dependent receptor [Proteobacteria bacterium]|nr:TonB-dependent receptor [Pseudomonadota bacterium]